MLSQWPHPQSTSDCTPGASTQLIQELKWVPAWIFFICHVAHLLHRCEELQQTHSCHSSSCVDVTVTALTSTSVLLSGGNDEQFIIPSARELFLSV